MDTDIALIAAFILLMCYLNWPRYYETVKNEEDKCPVCKEGTMVWCGCVGCTQPLYYCDKCGCDPRDWT